MAHSILQWLETLLGSNPSGRMLVIEVVPIQCSKLFKGMECAVKSMALCAIKSS